jgi:hypothetical protein
MGYKTLIQFFLRHLGYERNLFCGLTIVDMAHRKLAMGKRLWSSTMAVVANFGGVPAPRVAPTVAQAGAPPPS